MPELDEEWNPKNKLKSDEVTIGCNEIVGWICSECGYEWETEVYCRAIGGNGCSECSSSKGEKRVAEFLDDKNIYYIIEHKFPNCKNIRELPFDFFLPNNNICIEYDGNIHYKDKYNNPKEFKKVQKRDKIKTKYCKDNGIKLIRIPYWDYDNIEIILKKELKIK